MQCPERTECPPGASPPGPGLLKAQRGQRRPTQLLRGSEPKHTALPSFPQAHRVRTGVPEHRLLPVFPQDHLLGLAPLQPGARQGLRLQTREPLPAPRRPPNPTDTSRSRPCSCGTWEGWGTRSPVFCFTNSCQFEAPWCEDFPIRTGACPMAQEKPPTPTCVGAQGLQAASSEFRGRKLGDSPCGTSRQTGSSWTPFQPPGSSLPLEEETLAWGALPTHRLKARSMRSWPTLFTFITDAPSFLLSLAGKNPWASVATARMYQNPENCTAGVWAGTGAATQGLSPPLRFPAREPRRQATLL